MLNLLTIKKMKAEITMSQIWWNTNLISFFFRSQSENTLNELHDLAKDWEEVLNILEDMYKNLDDLEEDFYQYSAKALINDIGEEYFNI